MLNKNPSGIANSQELKEHRRNQSNHIPERDVFKIEQKYTQRVGNVFHQIKLPFFGATSLLSLTGSLGWAGRQNGFNRHARRAIERAQAL